MFGVLAKNSLSAIPGFADPEMLLKAKLVLAPPTEGEKEPIQFKIAAQ